MDRMDMDLQNCLDHPEHPIEGEILVQVFTEPLPLSSYPPNNIWCQRQNDGTGNDGTGVTVLAPNDLRLVLLHRRQIQASYSDRTQINYSDIDTYLQSFRT